MCAIRSQASGLSTKRIARCDALPCVNVSRFKNTQDYKKYRIFMISSPFHRPVHRASTGRPDRRHTPRTVDLRRASWQRPSRPPTVLARLVVVVLTPRPVPLSLNPGTVNAFVPSYMFTNPFATNRVKKCRHRKATDRPSTVLYIHSSAHARQRDKGDRRSRLPEATSHVMLLK